MVCIAAAVLTKQGNPLFARVFIDGIRKLRLEGLLGIFSKLITSNKSQQQHTFLDTENVRYIYQLFDKVYLVLITTKASNILEALKALSLFTNILREYCPSVDKKTIEANVFELIFAFDEVVSLGYYENVTLARIRTINAMQSQEETVFNKTRIAKEKLAIKTMRYKAKELSKRKLSQKLIGNGLRGKPNFVKNWSASLIRNVSRAEKDIGQTSLHIAAPSLSQAGRKPLVLKRRLLDEDQILKQIEDESGTKIEDCNVNVLSTVPAVLLKFEEKINATVFHHGGLNGEVLGSIQLFISEKHYSTVSVQMANNENRQVQFQVHPCLDKTKWLDHHLLELKSAQKPFPYNQELVILKWKFFLHDEEEFPVMLNCWVDEKNDGCIINLEYTLQSEEINLNNVNIVIPLPLEAVPVVMDCSESYEFVKSKSQLIWSLPFIDKTKKTGSFEFSTSNGCAKNFFPVQLYFDSPLLLCNIAENDSLLRMEAKS